MAFPSRPTGRNHHEFPHHPSPSPLSPLSPVATGWRRRARRPDQGGGRAKLHWQCRQKIAAAKALAPIPRYDLTDIGRSGERTSPRAATTLGPSPPKTRGDIRTTSREAKHKTREHSVWVGVVVVPAPGATTYHETTSERKAVSNPFPLETPSAPRVIVLARIAPAGHV